MGAPWLLDLYCGAGGASMGYHRAGFRVVGVDASPQPRYPFEFHQADALDFLDRWGSCFAVRAASPPCHDHSTLASVHGSNGSGWLLDATRSKLQRIGGPYVIENVANASMPGALTLCGSEFGLGVRCADGKYRPLRRHRKFESNIFLWGAGGCCCTSTQPIGVYGNGGAQRDLYRPNGGRRSYMGTLSERREAMGIDWMSRAELSQAIPPAYTQHIGEQLAAYLSRNNRRPKAPKPQSPEAHHAGRA